MSIAESHVSIAGIRMLKGQAALLQADAFICNEPSDYSLSSISGKAQGNLQEHERAGLGRGWNKGGGGGWGGEKKAY